MILLVLAAILGITLLATVAVGLSRTYSVEHSINQPKFVKGSVPSPNGFYKGNEQTGIGKSWQGKVFNQKEQTGINRFTDGEQFVFTTYRAKGLRDKNTEVLRIDYNQKENPWWLRWFIVDEIVEVKPDKYLGKVHLKLIPGMPFTLMYFELGK